jgi:dihydroneopterin aldolase
VTLTANITPMDDRLENAVDYEAVTEKIRAIALAGHINLAETLAEKIAATCLEDPRVVRARIRVEKLHALPGAEAAGVEIERSR